MFRLPPFLKQGDKVAIVATARKIKKSDIQSFLDLIEEWGYDIVLGDSIDEECHQFAGTDNLRARDLQRFLDDPEIKAIICAKGGYGTVRMIDKLNFTAFNQNPKWISGFSDVTVIHNHVHRNQKVASIHSCLLSQFNSIDTASKTSLNDALCGSRLDYSFEEHPLNRNGEMDAIVTGGNLSILYSLTGSISEVDTNGKILLIEDLDEYLYHTDRMIQQLKRAGKLDNLHGLLVGSFTSMKDNDIPFGITAEEIIKQAVDAFDYPVLFNFPSGHGTTNLAVRLGQRMEVKKSEKGYTINQE